MTTKHCISRYGYRYCHLFLTQQLLTGLCVWLLCGISFKPVFPFETGICLRLVEQNTTLFWKGEMVQQKMMTQTWTKERKSESTDLA